MADRFDLLSSEGRDAAARKRRAVWRSAARALGLQGPSPLRGLTLDGAIGLFGVRVEPCEDWPRLSADVTLRCDGPCALRRLQTRREYLDRLATRLTGGDGVATGDPAFDDALVVWGAPAPLAALFDAATRRATLRTFRAGGRWEDGILKRRILSAASVKALVSEIRATVALARRLVAHRDVPRRLAAHARLDPVGGVRLNNLEQLIQAFPERAKRLLPTAAKDRDPAVRLCAALALGHPDQAPLRRLATCEELEDEQQALVLAALTRPLGVRQSIRVLDAALSKRRRAVALEAIKMLGRTGRRPAIARLAVLDSQDVEIGVAACRALAATGDPAALAPLLSALAADSSDVRDTAARALGDVGTVECVEPLRAAVSAHPFDLSLRRVADTAIDAIQSRVAGAARGQLSLAEQGQGRLSVAVPEAPAGGVALAEDAANGTGSDSRRRKPRRIRP